MIDNKADLVIDILRKIQGDIAALKVGQDAGNLRLGGIEHHMAGFHVNVVHQSEELMVLKSRVERIEKRLDLTDA